MNKKQISGMGLALFVTFLAGMGISDLGDLEQKINISDIYYCEDSGYTLKDSFLICDQGLSPSRKTCYQTNDIGEKEGTRCIIEPYWEKLEDAIKRLGVVIKSPELVPLTGNQIQENGCVHYCPEGEGIYDVCFCENGRWAYRGEL